MPNGAGKPILLLAGQHALENRQMIDERLRLDWDIVTWSQQEPMEALDRKLSDAVALVPGGDLPSAVNWQSRLRTCRKLKLIQLPITGYEWLSIEDLPAGCIVANAYGHETAVAEYVMGGVLRWEIRFGDLDLAFRNAGWLGLGENIMGPKRREVRGLTMGIIGHGAIGRQVVKRAAGFDMRVICVSRSNRPVPKGCDWYGTMDSLPRLLSESDYVVIACSLNAETRGLIDKDRIALMKPDAVLVNVARGPIVDEMALFEALSNRTIGGAIIDVWYNYPHESQGGLHYPPPSVFSFESLDNVIVTPHIAARTEAAEISRWKFVADNLSRFAAQEDLQSIVMFGKLKKNNAETAKS